MGVEEEQTLLLYIDNNNCQNEEEDQAQDTNNNNGKLTSHNKNYKWWLQVTLYTLCTIGGMSSSTLLGKIYYNQNGHSKWLVATLQTAGFPFLIPFLFLSKTPPQQQTENRPSIFLLLTVYIVLGSILASGGILYSVAIDYLPASTYTLVNSTQLAFTALFSFFLNSQNFTPYIVNSVMLLTFAPMLLVFRNDDNALGTGPHDDYVLGVLFTLGASACPALLFSLTQLASDKLLVGSKTGEGIRDLLSMTISQSLVATIVTLVGLFASGEWTGLRQDLGGYEGGAFSYFGNVIGTAIACQAYNFGTIALTFKVSSLFSNVVIRLATPVVPFLSVVFLHEDMSGLKIMALWLALWGFASYVYQHYLDDLVANNKDQNKTSIDENS